MMLASLCRRALYLSVAPNLPCTFPLNQRYVHKSSSNTTTRTPKDRDTTSNTAPSDDINDITEKEKVALSFDIHPNHNQHITDILTELGKNEKNIGQMHKYNAYRVAVQSIKAHPTKLTSGAEAQDLPGVGKKIGTKIQEIIDTGKLGKLEQANVDERTQAINTIASVSGIGPAAAKKFVDVDGLKTLDDLRNISSKLNHHQQIGLKYYYDFEQKIPRAELTLLSEIVEEEVKKLDKKILFATCGSYRRGNASSGDIDVLLSHPKYTIDKKGKDSLHILDSLHSKLTARGFLIDDMSLGNSKYMGVCRLPESTQATDTNNNNNNTSANNDNFNPKKGKINTTTTTTTTTSSSHVSPKKFKKGQNIEKFFTVKQASSSGGKRKIEDEDSGESTEEDIDMAEKLKSKFGKKEVETHVNTADLDKFKAEINEAEQVDSDAEKCTSVKREADEKKSGHLARRIDIKLVPIESFYFGVMHATGSDEFNRQLRIVALQLGFSLSEYGLYPVGETGVKGDQITVNSEEEIFELLGQTYIPPDKRSI